MKNKEKLAETDRNKGKQKQKENKKFWEEL
jgi:hypothetical protein